MRVPVPDELLPADRLGRVHLVGIGGAGLSGIARILLARGVEVSGSDGTDSPTLAALADLGARVHVGHDAAQLGDLGPGDTLVVSTAVREDNVEYLEAVRRGLRVLPRSAALAALMAGRRVVAVAGTHGKTTTTSLLTVGLQAAGLDPTYAIGGDLAATGVNAAEGAGELFLAEADESDGAFLVYRPWAAVVTNVDADHLDQWGTEAAYAAAFEEFADHVDPDGVLVCCTDDPGAAALAQRQRARGRRVVTVGERPDADLVLTAVVLDGSGSSATVASGPGGSGERARLVLAVPGRHYLLDAAAAYAVSLALGASGDLVLAGMAAFTGTRRRMESRGVAAGVRVYDSYAHHPTEIAGDLEAARAIAGAGRLLVAFQPHLVSRTRIFGPAMGRELGAADEVVLLEVYLAREDADPEVTAALVAAHVPLPADRVALVAGLEQAAAELAHRARAGDLVLTLGAGTVTEVAALTLARLGELEACRG